MVGGDPEVLQLDHPVLAGVEAQFRQSDAPPAGPDHGLRLAPAAVDQPVAEGPADLFVVGGLVQHFVQQLKCPRRAPRLQFAASQLEQGLRLLAAVRGELVVPLLLDLRGVSRQLGGVRLRRQKEVLAARIACNDPVASGLRRIVQLQFHTPVGQAAQSSGVGGIQRVAARPVLVGTAVGFGGGQSGRTGGKGYEQHGDQRPAS